MLITRPNHDVTTNYLFYWSKPIIDLAIEKHVQIIDISGDKNTRNEVIGRIKKLHPTFVMFNGHGNIDRICGQNNEILIDTKNAVVLSGKITFSRSCSSAKVLGPQCVRSSGSFIGYDDEFVFLIDGTHTSKPLQDRVAGLFLESSNVVAVSLLKGHTTGKSAQRSRESFRQRVMKALSSDATGDEKDALPYLMWDMNHQVCLGDQTTTI